MNPIFLFLFFFGGLALTTRLLAGSFDRSRVERYAAEQGWKLVDIIWNPLGPGWFGEQNARIYRIAYEDQEGTLHRAHVKTSMWSGVYVSNDQIVERSTSQPGIAELQAENKVLRQRLRELEGDSGVIS